MSQRLWVAKIGDAYVECSTYWSVKTTDDLTRAKVRRQRVIYRPMDLDPPTTWHEVQITLKEPS